MDSSTNSLVADYQLWPREYRTIEAIVRTAVRLELPRLVARLPQILYVETDEAGNVVFEIHRRIHGRPVDRLYLSEVRSLLTDLEPVFAEIPVPQELLPLPEGYPASGDSAGFFTMLVDHLDSQYQTARRDEVIGPVLRVLGLPDSLAPELSALAAQVRSQPFRLLHADITSANILGLGKDAAVLVDFGLALYGPPDFELAILLQRDAKGATENSFIPAALQPYITLLDAMRVFNDLVRLIQQTDYRVLDPTRAQVTAHYLTRALPRAEDIWRKDGFTVANTLAFIRRILRLIEDLAASSPLYVADGAAALLRPDSAADPEAEQ
ncbi:MAG: phosphotransferase [Nocardia sp.]|nr:phosphotransferase [Nocardia sp.]